MYDVFPKNKSIERDYDSLIASLSDIEKGRLMTTIAKYPKGLPREQRTENIGRVEKKGNFWQYYIPTGERVIYDVCNKPKQVTILFVGDHEEAAIWLRKNAR